MLLLVHLRAAGDVFVLIFIDKILIIIVLSGIVLPHDHWWITKREQRHLVTLSRRLQHMPCFGLRPSFQWFVRAVQSGCMMLDSALFWCRMVRLSVSQKVNWNIYKMRGETK